MKQYLRAVLVGCGNISVSWLNAALRQHDLIIVGLVDLEEQAAQRRASEFELQHVVIGTDLAAVLAQTSPDVVFNCTTPQAHYPVTLTALRHGCHVLSEEPIAHTSEEALALTAAAKEANKTLAVMQNFRYCPQARRLRQFLASGVLGAIHTIHTDFFIGAHFNDFRDHMPHVLLLEMAIHIFDLARLLSGAEPLSVYCHEWNPPGSWYHRDASAITIFEMTKSIIYTFRGSWCADGLNTNWSGTWRITGERGSAVWDSDSMRAQVIDKDGGFRSTYQELEIPEVDYTNVIGGHAGALEHFLAYVSKGEQPETSCTNAIKSLAMVFAAIESAALGQRVPIKQATDRT